MRAPSMISLLSVVLCVCCVFVPALGQPYTLYNSNFKDPYTDLGGALLDVNVKLCSNWNADNDQLDSISVTIPTSPSPLATSNNGYFVGPAFTDLPIPGVAIRGDNVPHDVTLLVSWDGTSKLTFRGFHLSSWTVVQVPGRGDSSPYWVNVNFDVVPSTFISPWDPSNPGQFITTIPAGKLPLAITLYPVVAAATPDAKPNINEVDLSLFDAEPPNGEKPAICNGGSSTQDPIFSGFQGQVFQFHGLPDEHFNLVSSPDVQLNSHFIYLSSGKCDYNETECYTHPGTYMDVLGFSIADSHVKLVAGTHEQGLRVWVNDQELQRGARINALSTNTTAAIQYHHNGRVTIQTEIMNFELVNSDMFMNLHVSLNVVELLRVGSKHHTVTDHALCKTNFETHNHQLIESTVAKKYPVTTPLHGLIGQTWRNVKVCGRDWMGTVQDYLVSDLFASDNHYNYFKW